MGFCNRKGVECGYSIECDTNYCRRRIPDVKEDKYHGDCITQEMNKLMDTVKGLSCFWTPNLDTITGVVDSETGGEKFAIGTKNHSDAFVLNFKDKSCLLFMGDIQPIDLRQFNFDEFTSIEINGNKFVKENNHD